MAPSSLISTTLCLSSFLAPSALSRPLPNRAARTNDDAAVCVAFYGQCGGDGFTGDTSCCGGATCEVQNQWYSQCLPATCASNYEQCAGSANGFVEGSVTCCDGWACTEINGWYSQCTPNSDASPATTTVTAAAATTTAATSMASDATAFAGLWEQLQNWTARAEAVNTRLAELEAAAAAPVQAQATVSGLVQPGESLVLSHAFDTAAITGSWIKAGSDRVFELDDYALVNSALVTRSEDFSQEEVAGYDVWSAWRGADDALHVVYTRARDTNAGAEYKVIRTDSTTGARTIEQLPSPAVNGTLYPDWDNSDARTGVRFFGLAGSQAVGLWIESWFTGNDCCNYSEGHTLHIAVDAAPAARVEGLASNQEGRVCMAPTEAGGFVVSYTQYTNPAEQLGEARVVQWFGSSGEPSGEPIIVEDTLTHLDCKLGVAGDNAVILFETDTPDGLFVDTVTVAGEILAHVSLGTLYTNDEDMCIGTTPGSPTAILAYEIGGPDALAYALLNTETGQLTRAPQMVGAMEPTSVACTAHADGGFTVLWADDESLALSAQYFDDAGVPHPHPTVLNLPAAAPGYEQLYMFDTGDSGYDLLYVDYTNNHGHAVRATKGVLELTQTAAADGSSTEVTLTNHGAQAVTVALAALDA